MAIYLEDQDRNYLKSILEEETNKKIGKYWIAKQLINQIQLDQARRDEIIACPHAWGEYVGKKQCCTKCGAHDVGMGESWDKKK